MLGQIDIGEQGMGYVDFNPVLGGNNNGYVTVRVERPDDNVHGQLTLYQYVDPGNHALGFVACGAPVEFEFTSGLATAAVPIVGPCYLATMVLVRSGPANPLFVFGSHISWSATATISIGLARPVPEISLIQRADDGAMPAGSIGAGGHGPAPLMQPAALMLGALPPPSGGRSSPGFVATDSRNPGRHRVRTKSSSIGALGHRRQ